MSFCAKIVVSKETACTIGKLKSRAFDRCVGSRAVNGCQEKEKTRNTRLTVEISHRNTKSPENARINNNHNNIHFISNLCCSIFFLLLHGNVFYIIVIGILSLVAKWSVLSCGIFR
jgi:hypothetical protein